MADETTAEITTEESATAHVTADRPSSDEPARPAAEDGAAAESAERGHLGVIATFRATPRQARALLVGVFVNKLAAFMQIFLVLFLTHRGFTAGQAGFALGVYGAGAVVGTMIGGSVSDALNPRSATLISMWGSAGLLVSIVYIHNYYMILVPIVLVSMIGQLYRPAAQAMIAEMTPPERLVMVTAIYRLSLNLGTTAAPVLGVALVSISYNLLFWGEAIAALSYGVAAIWMLPARPRAAAVEASEGAADGAETEAQAQAAAEGVAPGVAEPKKPRFLAGYRELWRDRRYMIYLFAFLLLNITYHQYTGALPLAIVKAGLSIWWYASVISFNAITVVLFEVWVTKYVQTWPAKAAQMGGFLLLSIGYFFYSIQMAPTFIVLGTLLFSISEIVGAPTLYAYPGMIAPSHLRGRYFGAMQSTYGLGSTIGPIVGIIIFEHVGQRVFLYAALLALVGAFIGQIGLRRPTPAPAPAGVGAESVA